MPTAKDYKNAILVQDAVNLSGVVKSFSEVLTRIWEEARELGKGTDYVNTHPISILYSDKIADLTGSRDFLSFSDAYRICNDKSKE